MKLTYMESRIAEKLKVLALRFKNNENIPYFTCEKENFTIIIDENGPSLIYDDQTYDERNIKDLLYEIRYSFDDKKFRQTVLHLIERCLVETKLTP